MKIKKFDGREERDVYLIDYHIHTTYSDGNNNPEDMIQKAIASGIREIAFTDHVWKTSDWIDRYIEEINMLRKKYPQIKILIGVEAKALNRKGDIDASEDTIKKVDFVMGVCHRRLPLENPPFDNLINLSAEEAAKIETEVSINLLKNKDIAFLGHPGRTYHKFFNKIFPKEALTAIAEASKKTGKPVEFNTKLPWIYAFVEIVAKLNAPFVIGSDAHTVHEIGKIDYKKIKEILENAKKN